MNYEVKVFRDEILAIVHRENTEKNTCLYFLSFDKIMVNLDSNKNLDY